MRERILNQPIDFVSMEDAATRAKAALLNPKQFKITTLNPEMIIYAQKNIEMQAAINNSHLVVPDGTGIIWAYKLLNPSNLQNIERVPGIELAEKILEAGNSLGKKVAIFGSTNEVLEKASALIKNKFPNIQLVKTIHGFMGKENDEKIAGEIAEVFPDIVLIALGTPRQEIWINKYGALFPKSVIIGIGGSLDIWARKKKRAPEWMRDYHLEWLYRAISEPQRLPRVIRSLPVFVLLVLQNKYSRTSH